LFTDSQADSQADSRRCEWLVISGDIEHGDECLSARDYHVTMAALAQPAWFSRTGALLFLRESVQASTAAEIPFTVRDAEAGWPDFAPGIQRRVLWQHDGQAAMLYYAQAGAQVPLHTHGHDEECLMVQGELFLDDLLLQPGDYQLAPAGSGHRITQTDTGAVIYAHGDLDLQLIS
jgi:anti-sigma factor ChrR (cupin superfamily)